MSFVEVLPCDDLWIGEMRAILLGDTRVLLLRVAEGVRAYEDRCAHLGFPLSRGRLEGTVLTCSAHHYEYDVLTGHGINPRSASLRSFPTRIEAGRILVDVSSSEEGAAPGD